ncbi:MAG: type II toxin-antitoxin system VapC family toxin [Gemmatimonadota bacterium]
MRLADPFAHRRDSGSHELLLDTHALLWWIFDDPGLSSAARDAIRDPQNRVLVSSASGWEIAMKHRLGKLPEAGKALENLPASLRRARFETLPIALEHAITAGALPGPRRDPFDRMLIAQSRLEGLPIVTNDPVFKRYDARTIW